jgi:hypothetical protein
MNVSIPVILTFSLVLLLNTGSSNIYGQIIDDTNQANQTSGQNTTQQLEQANQQLAQTNQTQQQVSNQTQQQLAQTNQTSGQNTTQQANQQQLAQTNQTQQQANQSKQQDPELGEKLLNYTNAAILALNDDDIGAAQDNLVQIQNELINSSGKQVVIIPAPAVAPSSSDDDGDSD